MKRKLLALLLAALMTLALVPLAALAKDTEPETPATKTFSESKLYLSPISYWYNDDARFAMYLFDGDNPVWVTMNRVREGFYCANIPAGTWNKVIFVRLNPDKPENSWDNKWNQTENITLEEGKNCFYITGSTGSGADERNTGYWGVYNYKTVFAINSQGWSDFRVYCWVSDSDHNTWPGDVMIACTGTANLYRYDIPNSYDKVIFTGKNSYNDLKQTVDITTGVTEGACWSINNETDSSNKYTVTNAGIVKTIRFDSNRGSGTMNDVYFTDASYNLTLNNLFNREAFDFANWNTAADGLGTSYNDNAEINLTADTTLYAQWTPKAPTVSFTRATLRDKTYSDVSNDVRFIFNVSMNNSRISAGSTMYGYMTGTPAYEITGFRVKYYKGNSSEWSSGSFAIQRLFSVDSANAVGNYENVQFTVVFANVDPTLNLALAVQYAYKAFGTSGVGVYYNGPAVSTSAQNVNNLNEVTVLTFPTEGWE